MVGVEIVHNRIVEKPRLWGCKRFVEQNDAESLKIKNVGVRKEIKEMQWFELATESTQPLWCIYALCWVNEHNYSIPKINNDVSL